MRIGKFHKVPIWVAHSKGIQAFHGLSIMINFPDESVRDFSVQVIRAEETEQNPGKCCVRVFQHATDASTVEPVFEVGPVVPAAQVVKILSNVYLDEVAIQNFEKKRLHSGAG